MSSTSWAHQRSTNPTDPPLIRRYHFVIAKIRERDIYVVFSHIATVNRLYKPEGRRPTLILFVGVSRHACRLSHVGPDRRHTPLPHPCSCPPLPKRGLWFATHRFFARPRSHAAAACPSTSRPGVVGCWCWRHLPLRNPRVVVGCWR